MTDLERRLVLHVLRHPNDTQRDIAKTFKMDQAVITRGLLGLKKRGIVELQSKGKPPRLAISSKLDALEEALYSLLVPVLEAAS